MSPKVPARTTRTPDPQPAAVRAEQIAIAVPSLAQQGAEVALAQGRGGIKDYDTKERPRPTFREESDSCSRGQTDYRLAAIVEGREVARVDYSVFEGQPSVKMIEAFEPRQGFATALMEEIQRRHPDREIKTGCRTPDGQKFYESLTFEEVPSEEAPLFTELAQLREELADLMKAAGTAKSWDELSDEEKSLRDQETDRFNAIHDRIREIEQETLVAAPTKRILKSRQDLDLPQTQTQAFKNWFGASLIRDSKGPMAVFHGSDWGFDAFEHGHENGWSQARKGFYFTDDHEMASEFGEPKAFYLRMERPADFAYWTSPDDNQSETLDAILEHLPELEKQRYYDPSYYTSEPIRKSPYRCAGQGLLQTEEFVNAAIKAGFDGLIIDDRLGNARGFTSFVVFEPTQIKSADENSGSFAPECPRFRE